LEEVGSIEVSLEEVTGITPAVGPFIAAPEDHGRLLALVQGGTGADPMPWPHLGLLRIHREGQPDVLVYLFVTGEERGAYRVGERIQYRGSSDAEFIRTITECARRGAPR
jgi:hypothetical protein